VTKCRESRTKLEENVETLLKTHKDLLHNREKCALDIKVGHAFSAVSHSIKNSHIVFSSTMWYLYITVAELT